MKKSIGRPAPTVLLSKKEKNGKCYEILKAACMYAVYYDGEPFNIKESNINNYDPYLGREQPPPKYKKTTFYNTGHAFTMASRLNAKYDTDKFEVFALSKASLIVQDELQKQYNINIKKKPSYIKERKTK